MRICLFRLKFLFIIFHFILNKNNYLEIYNTDMKKIFCKKTLKIQ